MNTVNRILILCTIIVMSCGPSKEEHAALLKAHSDSVRISTEQRMTRLQDLKNSIADFEAQAEGMENRISAFRARLEVANDRLARIKEFQLGRSSAEREDQIHSQVLVIDELERDIAETLEGMMEVKRKLTETRQELARLERKNP